MMYKIWENKVVYLPNSWLNNCFLEESWIRDKDYIYLKNILPLGSKKQGDFENSLVMLGFTPLWHVAQWVSRAPPNHTLPAFLNLNGSLNLSSLKLNFLRSLNNN